DKDNGSSRTTEANAGNGSSRADNQTDSRGSGTFGATGTKSDQSGIEHPHLNKQSPDLMGRLETVTTKDGLRYLIDLPVTTINGGMVEKKMATIGDEIERARHAGLNEYADALERHKRDYDKLEDPAARTKFCSEMAERIKSEHGEAKRNIGEHGLAGITGKT